MTGVGEPNDLTESDPNGAGPDGLAGGMGVSSERVGKVRGTRRTRRRHNRFRAGPRTR